MWTFEQEQSFALTNVATVVRMTVIKLQSGGLWVYAPIAPTRCAGCLVCCVSLRSPHARARKPRNDLVYIRGWFREAVSHHGDLTLPGHFLGATEKCHEV